jgi:hypothetical protein
MERIEEREHALHGLTGSELAIALTGKYSFLTIYGGWAAITQLPTFVAIGGPNFAIAWASTVCMLSLLALAGIARTWMTGRFRMEKWTTFTFICVFVGYSFALIYRAGDSGDWGAAPTSLIPLAVCVLPVIRWIRLIRRQETKSEEHRAE